MSCSALRSAGPAVLLACAKRRRSSPQDVRRRYLDDPRHDGMLMAEGETVPSHMNRRRSTMYMMDPFHKVPSGPAPSRLLQPSCRALMETAGLALCLAIVGSMDVCPLLAWANPRSPCVRLWTLSQPELSVAAAAKARRVTNWALILRPADECRIVQKSALVWSPPLRTPFFHHLRYITGGSQSSCTIRTASVVVCKNPTAGDLDHPGQLPAGCKSDPARRLEHQNSTLYSIRAAWARWRA